jgi:preprotein translocase subunit SecE
MEKFKKAIARLTTFLVESWQEVRFKVTWPSRKEVWGTTLVVLVTTLIFAGYLGVLDYGMFKVMDQVFAYFA